MVWFFTIIFISQYLACFNCNFNITKKIKIKENTVNFMVKRNSSAYVIKHTKIKGNTEYADC